MISFLLALLPNKNFPAQAFDIACQIASAYEGLSGLKNGKYFPYHGKADNPSVWTIGRGHVITSSDITYGILIEGVRYKPFLGLTLKQVNQLFMNDMIERIDFCWNRIGKRGTNPQVACWLDLTFNCPSALSDKNSPIKKWKINNIKGAAESIMEYINSDGKPRRGLFRRRGTDALALCTGEIFIAKTDKAEMELESKLKKAGISYKKPKFEV